MNAHHWTGDDDERNFSGQTKPIRGLFFRAYRMAVRTGAAEGYLEYYRQQGPQFAALVAEVESNPDYFCQAHRKPLQWRADFGTHDVGCADCAQ